MITSQPYLIKLLNLFKGREYATDARGDPQESEASDLLAERPAGSLSDRYENEE